VTVPAREPLPRTAEDDAEDAAFFRLYGEWAPLDPAGVAELMDGFTRPWWFVGGWAIEAFTRAPREHEDVDLSILACDIPALRDHVGDRWHLWSNHGGTLRPLTDDHPDVLDVRSQIWIRATAQDPWVADLPITPDRDGLWTNKFLPDHVVPVDEATWVDADGLRHLRPEIVLFFKARHRRPKDERDLDRAWPLLDAGQRTWLRDAVRTLDAANPWLDRLDRI
jgi:hypothetical protein